MVAWHENDKINVTDVPLVVYTSNTRMSYNSNFSTFKLSYSDQEKFGAIRNGFETVTRNNLTDDENWSTCVGCAIIRRQQERLGEEQSDECKNVSKNIVGLVDSKTLPLSLVLVEFQDLQLKPTQVAVHLPRPNKPVPLPDHLQMEVLRLLDPLRPRKRKMVETWLMVVYLLQFSLFLIVC